MQTINLLSGLTITDTVSIDGYTQPGASRNTLAVGTNANVLVDVQPAQKLHAADFTLAAGSNNSSVSGLAFGTHDGIPGTALSLESNGNRVAGNYIGLNAAGTDSDSLDFALFIDRQSERHWHLRCRRSQCHYYR